MEGYATIGLEAVADYGLWIWHSAFGFPGALNDLRLPSSCEAQEIGDKSEY